MAFSYQIIATNNPTSFSASGLPPGLTLVNATTGLISGTPTVSGSYDVLVTATNGSGTGSAVVHLTLAEPPPVVTGVLMATVLRGTPFTYKITANNNPTSYGAFVLPGGLTIDPPTGVINGSPLVENTYKFTITATNSGGTGSATFTLTVLPPTPVINSPLTATGFVGGGFAYQITTVDPIITPINPVTGSTGSAFAAFGVPPDMTLDPVSGVISGTPKFAGSYRVILEAGSTGGIGVATITMNIVTPLITSPLAVTGTVGVLFDYQITSSYNGIVTQKFSSTALPPGLTLDTVSGVISGVPTVDGNYSAVITAIPLFPIENPPPAVSAVLIFTIGLNKPAITSPTVASGQQSVPFSYQITATGSPTSFSATGLPAGLTVNTTGGLISGTPTVAGGFSVQISATNSIGTGSATLVLSISTAPGITSPLNVTAIVGQLFFYQITSTNTGQVSETFTSSTLPANLSLDRQAGVISGIPANEGTFQMVITATPGDGGPALSAILTITVAGAVPVITSQTSASGVQYQPFSYQITASGGPTSYAATGLPDGLLVSSATGLISGSPSVAGSFTAQISATNSKGTGPATLSISIESAGTTLIQFDQSTFSAVTTDASATLLVDVLRATGDTNPITIDYATTDGTAKAGIDYVASSGTVTISGDASQQTINIPLIPQSVTALDRSFTVTLSNASHGVLGATNKATVVISFPDLSTKLTNISTRGFVGSDQQVMIAGLIINGEASKQLVLRGLGPSLTAKGVIDAISDPTLALMDANGTQLASNDDYAGLPTVDQGTLATYNLTPTDSRESALVETLPAGNYTAILRGKTNGFGLVEVYDISGSRLSRFANISTRAQVQAGDNGALIGGFIVQAANNTVGTAQTVLIRAIGPTLSSFGIDGALADPTIDLYRGSELIMSNDNWKTDNQDAIEATGLQPANDKEAAILVTLDPGAYTAVIRGKNNTTGIGLVEVYQMP